MALHPAIGQKNRAAPKDRPEAKHGTYITFSKNRYKITANWARVAVPAGFSRPSVVPEMIPSAIAQVMGSVAAYATEALSGNADRSARPDTS